MSHKYNRPADIRILLAEDNPANQIVIKTILESADLQCRHREQWP